MKLFRTFASCAIVSATAAYMHEQEKLDMNEPIRQTISGEHDCTGVDWQFARLAETSGLLKSQPLPTHTCKAISFPNLPSAQIVQVTGWQKTDVFVSLTIVRADKNSPLHVVTALGGLVVNRDREDDSTNKTAFNELLATLPYNPETGRPDILDIAALYMFMVGHPPNDTPRTLAQSLTVSDVLGTVSHQNDHITVNIHQRMSPPFGNSNKEWTLEFRVQTNHLQILSVVPQGTSKISVRILDGRTGKPLRARQLLVRLDHIDTGAGGSIDVPVELSETFQFFDLYSLYSCDVIKQTDRGETYSAQEIIDHGVVSKNFCGKARTQPTARTIVLYMRPRHSWEAVRDFGSLMKDATFH